jgi:hypothetical protein
LDLSILFNNSGSDLGPCIFLGVGSSASLKFAPKFGVREQQLGREPDWVTARAVPDGIPKAHHRRSKRSNHCNASAHRERTCTRGLKVLRLVVHDYDIRCCQEVPHLLIRDVGSDERDVLSDAAPIHQIPQRSHVRRAVRVIGASLADDYSTRRNTALTEVRHSFNERLKALVWLNKPERNEQGLISLYT